MLKDMMPHVELFQPTDVDNALALMGRFGSDGWALAGGHDSLAWFKDRGKRPTALIDLAGISELLGIRETSDGIEIGAMTTLTEIELHPMIQEKFGLLAGILPRVSVSYDRRRECGIRSRAASPCWKSLSPLQYWQFPPW